jgi:hypothetical protein
MSTIYYKVNFSCNNKIFSGYKPCQQTKTGRRSVVLMMGTETVPETSANFSLLTQLIAREDFINSWRRENFKSYSFYQDNLHFMVRF